VNFIQQFQILNLKRSFYMAKMFQVYGIGQALIPVLPPPIGFENAPTSNQTNYEIGQVVYTPPLNPTSFYMYAGAGVWSLFSSATGDIVSVAGTPNQVAANTVGGVATVSLPVAITAPGSLATTTTLASGTTLTVGTKLLVTTGANASVGTSAAMTSGAVTVANTSVTASSLIFAVPATLGTVTAPQAYYISSKTAGTSFTITSASAIDTSTWNYWIIN
jgi:hypothetical protein